MKVNSNPPLIRSRNVRSVLKLDETVRRLQQKIGGRESELAVLRQQLEAARVKRAAKSGALTGGQLQELSRARARRAVAQMPEFGDPSAVPPSQP